MCLVRLPSPVHIESLIPVEKRPNLSCLVRVPSVQNFQYQEIPIYQHQYQQYTKQYHTSPLLPCESAQSSVVENNLLSCFDLPYRPHVPVGQIETFGKVFSCKRCERVADWRPGGCVPVPEVFCIGATSMVQPFGRKNILHQNMTPCEVVWWYHSRSVTNKLASLVATLVRNSAHLITDLITDRGKV